MSAIPPLPDDVQARLDAFIRHSRFAEHGGVVTDLDGTAVLEREGRILVAEPVAIALKRLVELGRPVVINTLRFPLNVIQTFGREWGAITDEPVPLVSLNGAVTGLLTPVGESETVFRETAAFPLSEKEVADAVAAVERMVADGLENVAVFHYPRDWREGEIIWTPDPDRIEGLRAKYLSASSVGSSTIEALADALVSHGTCMLMVLADVPEDRRMAYQHANPRRFLTTAGVDKLSGARDAAVRLGFDLDQSVGAGDTPMDRFLCGVGLALQVGPLEPEHLGRVDTIRLRDPLELGAALGELARLHAPEPVA